MVGELARTFAERGIHATWATVGMLFASSRTELEPYLPAVRPAYDRPGLDPYEEHVGEDESSDPLHLAGSLVRLVAGTPHQEIGSHTFSHYYCLEPGQTEEALRADLASAQSIADVSGLKLKSIVLPRNQWNPAYNRALLDCGFTCYRGPQRSWSHRPRLDGSSSHLQRLVRLAGTYAGPRLPPSTAWSDVTGPDGLCNVPASAFLRPYTRQTASALEPADAPPRLRDASRREELADIPPLVASPQLRGPPQREQRPPCPASGRVRPPRFLRRVLLDVDGRRRLSLRCRVRLRPYPLEAVSTRGRVHSRPCPLEAVSTRGRASSGPGGARKSLVARDSGYLTRFEAYPAA